MTRFGLAAALVAAVCLVAAARMRSEQAAPSASQYFDTTQTITLKGRVNGVIHSLDRTYLMLEVDAGRGATERWAVQGRSFSALGWAPRTAPVSLGDTVSVVAYRVRAGSNVEASLPQDYPRLIESAKAGRLAQGTDLTLSDGRTLAFGEQ